MRPVGPLREGALTRPYLLVDACSYCYGAAGTTSAVLDRLPLDVPCVLVADGSSLELLGRHERVSAVVRCDTEDWSQLQAIEEVVAGAALAFVNTNPVMTIFARRHGVPTVYLDIIPWLSPSIAVQTGEVAALPGNREGLAGVDAIDLFAGAEHFLLQSYLTPFAVDPSIAAPRVIAPVLHSSLYGGPAPSERDDRLLVSTGGLFNPDVPAGALEDYARAVAQAAIETAAEQGIPEVRICGPERLRELISERVGAPTVRVGHVSHGDFIDLLMRSRFAAVAPGLTSIYECFVSGVPTLLLPPTNLSQVHQVAAVRECILAGELDAGLALDDRFAAVDGEDEMAATAKIADVLAAASADGSLLAALRDGFRALVRATDNDLLHARRRQYVLDLGGDGAAEAASVIAWRWREASVA